MRTTIDIDPELVAEVIEMTGEPSRGRAVNKVMAEWVRKQKIEQLIALAGKLDIRDNWEEWEEAELEAELEHKRDRR